LYCNEEAWESWSNALMAYGQVIREWDNAAGAARYPDVETSTIRAALTAVEKAQMHLRALAHDVEP
jgi:hypothetical protein